MFTSAYPFRYIWFWVPVPVATHTSRSPHATLTVLLDKSMLVFVVGPLKFSVSDYMIKCLWRFPQRVLSM